MVCLPLTQVTLSSTSILGQLLRLGVVAVQAAAVEEIAGVGAERGPASGAKRIRQTELG